MRTNATLDSGTTMKDFRSYIRTHQHGDYYSNKFSKDIYATAAYRSSGHKTQQDHLDSVAAAMPEDRLAIDFYYRCMNPSLLLRIIEDAGAPSSTVKGAFDRGKLAFEASIENGLPVSAALGRACAAIRNVSWIYLHCTSAEDVLSWPHRSEAALP